MKSNKGSGMTAEENNQRIYKTSKLVNLLSIDIIFIYTSFRFIP